MLHPRNAANTSRLTHGTPRRPFAQANSTAIDGGPQRSAGSRSLLTKFLQPTAMHPVECLGTPTAPTCRAEPTPLSHPRLGRCPKLDFVREFRCLIVMRVAHSFTPLPRTGYSIGSRSARAAQPTHLRTIGHSPRLLTVESITKKVRTRRARKKTAPE